MLVVDPPARHHATSPLVSGIAREGRILYDTYLTRQRDAFLTINDPRKTKNARLVGRSTRWSAASLRSPSFLQTVVGVSPGMRPLDSEMTVDDDQNRSSKWTCANLFRKYRGN